MGVPLADEIVAIEPLSGGVSSDVFMVDLGGHFLCIKFAIECLRVEQEWHAPLRRSAAEFEWLTFVGNHFPEYVPGVIGHDAESHGTAMTFLPADTHPNWKAQLLGGTVDVMFAAAVGRRLAKIHAASTRQLGIADRFANRDDFEALRISPYLRFTASRHPAFADHINALADALGATKIALVHGDVSPKNILCGTDGPVFIDAECATFGDPAFDIAFVLNHLVLKAIIRPAYRMTLTTAAAGLWAAYRQGIDWENPEALDRRVARLLPALMLARVDGKSPLEYLTPQTADQVRRRACALLNEGVPDTITLLGLPIGASR